VNVFLENSKRFAGLIDRENRALVICAAPTSVTVPLRSYSMSILCMEEEKYGLKLTLTILHRPFNMSVTICEEGSRQHSLTIVFHKTNRQDHLLWNIHRF
jgi:hypothetical protein